MEQLAGLGRAVLRWLAASVVGIALVLVLAWSLPGSAVGFAFAGLLVVAVPLVIARRHATVGAWIAASMLAAVPFALLMARTSLDQPLVISHWRCGTGEAMLWLFGVPVVQGVMALSAGVLWRGRRRLGRLWRPASIVGLALSAGLLLPGMVRTLQAGSAADVESVLARAEAIELPPVPSMGIHTDEAAGLVLERACAEGRCELRLLSTDPEAERRSIHHEWAADAPLTVHVLDGWRVVEGQSPHTRRGRIRVAVDVSGETPWLRDLHRRHVADAFGPSWASLGLLLLAVLSVLGSSRLAPYAPLVWRRLGARNAEAESGRVDEVIALRMTHLAVLVVAALPMIASAWIGLVL